MGDTSQAITRATAAAESRAAEKSHRLRVLLSFFAIYVIWGYHLAIRYAVATIPPLYTAGFRHLFAGSILMAWALAKGLRPTWAQVRASIVIGFLFFLVGHGSLHWAERMSRAGLLRFDCHRAYFCFSAFFCVGAQMAIELDARNGHLAWTCWGRDVVRDTSQTPQQGMTIGSVMILIGAFSWSLGIIYSRRSHLSGKPLLLSALSLLAGSAMLLFTATVVGEAKGFALSQVTTKSWLALGYLILFGSVFAFSAYNWLGALLSYAYSHPHLREPRGGSPSGLAFAGRR